MLFPRPITTSMALARNTRRLRVAGATPGEPSPSRTGRKTVPTPHASVSCSFVPGGSVGAELAGIGEGEIDTDETHLKCLGIIRPSFVILTGLGSIGWSRRCHELERR